jgi:hypothetical protein
MLIINNGAFKSGSTWLFKILKEMTNFESIPKEYQNPNWKNSSIDPKKLKMFLENGDYSIKNYLSKNHFADKKKQNLILQNPNILVVGINRDIRDVVVSAYHHQLRYRPEDSIEDFTNFYWKRGRRVVNNVLKYNSLWGLQSSKIYISNYEILKNDTYNEINKIAKFIGFCPSEQEIYNIIEKTSFERMSKSGHKHLRKGEIGDWQNYLSKAMQKDIGMIEKKGLENLSFFERAKAKIRVRLLELR